MLTLNHQHRYWVVSTLRCFCPNIEMESNFHGKFLVWNVFSQAWPWNQWLRFGLGAQGRTYLCKSTSTQNPLPWQQELAADVRGMERGQANERKVQKYLLEWKWKRKWPAWHGRERKEENHRSNVYTLTITAKNDEFFISYHQVGFVARSLNCTDQICI